MKMWKKWAIAAFLLAFALSASATQVPTGTNPNGTIQYSDTSLQVNVNGNPVTNVPTYHAVVADLTPAATATDIVTISGSATKTVKITKIAITADATGASVLDFYTFIRSAADTGGTSAAVTAASHDSNNPAPTAAVLKYTANPATLGAGVMFASDHYALPAAATTGYPGTPWVVDAGIRNTQPIVLRGTSQFFTVNLNGQTIPAGTVVYVNIEWTEE